MRTYRQPGTVLTDHHFSVPLDHGKPDGERITVFAREVADPDGRDRPFLVFLAWSRDDRASATSGGWLESVRRANFAGLTGTSPAPQAAAPGAGRRHDEATIDDDEHLAAYNEFLAKINAAESRRTTRSQGKPR